MSVTRFGLIPRRAGLSVEQFQAHWRDPHAALAAQLPGIRRYWQNHRLLTANPVPWPGFDACSEIDADSVGAHLRMRDSAVMRGPIAADEPQFLAMDARLVVWTSRLGPARVAGRGGVRLLTFLRAAPGRAGEELASALAATVDAGGEAFGPVALPGEVAASAFDAVEARWFESSAAAASHLASPAFERDRRRLTGLVAGEARLLARVEPVV